MSLSLEEVQKVLGGLLPEDRLPSLLSFTQKMLSINETLNLTRWTQPQEVLVHHLLDSAQCLEDLGPMVKPTQRWLDLGSGCGFPGVLLAAAYPQLSVTLLDSVAKKTKALASCVEGLGWNVSVLTGRAEEVGRDPQTRESFDGVLARAVADLPVVLEYALPLLKGGGYLVNWMTQEQIKVVDGSRNALQTLAGKIVKNKEYSLPGLDQSRCLLIVEKMGKTPEAYPRPIGRPSKDPL